MALFWCIVLLCLASTFAQPTTSEQWVSYNDIVRQSARLLRLITNKLESLELLSRGLDGRVGPGGQTRPQTPTPTLLPGGQTRPQTTTVTPTPPAQVSTVHVPTTFLPDSTVRLAGGSPDGRAGRVEVMHHGEWGTVCDDGFGSDEATIVCKSLGFNLGEVLPGQRYGPGNGTILMDSVSCTGSESRLAECSHNGWGVSNCDHSEDVNIICYRGPCGSNLNYVDTVDRDLSSRGLQYLCEVTRDDTDQQQTSTCADLITDLPGGISNANALLGRGGQFGCWMGTRDVADPGRLGACQPNYQHTQQLSACASCTRMFVCIDYPGVEMMRLAGGNTSSEGRLEVFHDGWWGTVCSHMFDVKDAIVVCRNYGYPMGVPVSPLMFGRGRGPLVLSRVACTGAETDFFACPHVPRPQADCAHNQDAGVKCQRGPCGSRMHYFGRTRSVQSHNGFDDICYISRSDIDAVNVPCEDLLQDLELGFSNSTALVEAGGSFGCWTGNSFNRDAGLEVSCQHNYQNTARPAHCLHCSMMFICINYPPSPTIRLVGDPTGTRGRLEILHNDLWGTVCDDNFDDVDATVVCRSLGFHYGIYRYTAVFGRGRGNMNIWLDEVNCRGDEARLEDCSHKGWGRHNCRHNEDVGVECGTIAGLG